MSVYRGLGVGALRLGVGPLACGRGHFIGLSLSLDLGLLAGWASASGITEMLSGCPCCSGGTTYRPGVVVEVLTLLSLTLILWLEFLEGSTDILLEAMVALGAAGVAL